MHASAAQESLPFPAALSTQLTVFAASACPAADTAANDTTTVSDAAPVRAQSLVPVCSKRWLEAGATLSISPSITTFCPWLTGASSV